MALENFEQLPRRIFLDSSTLQTLQNYGEFVWENVEIPQTNRIWSIPTGIQNLEALRNVFFVGQRADFEFALSDNSLSEVSQKKDAQYLQWAYDVLDHWLACLEEAEDLPNENLLLAAKLDGNSFGYLGAGDRALIKDAVLLNCDGRCCINSYGDGGAGIFDVWQRRNASDSTVSVTGVNITKLSSNAEA